ncbi:MAG: protein kinase [Deltaproteobacteria bacterium]|nr:protein kinase [Deltaproteobacteria bacterium]
MRTLPFRLGRFTLFDHVASGGMADIYLARVKTELGGARLLVIKEILPHLSQDPRSSELLIDEAKLSAQLTHANIARVEELGRQEDTLYIAMEYVEGLDLRELLKQCSVRKLPLPMEYRLYVVRELLRALDYAHHYQLEDAVGVIHRDVSPSNVLLSFSGEVKLCDFGIASVLRVGGSASETIEGKAGYMSPEQARGERLDGRADIFAAGILLWELLAGRRMYKAAEGTSLIELARKGEVPALRKLDLPDAGVLERIVARALAAAPTDRYATAAEMFDDLYGYCLGTRQMASALRFGEWLSSHFAEEKLARRRARERALMALEHGPVLVMEPIPSVAGSIATPPTAASEEGPLDALVGDAPAEPARTPKPSPSAATLASNGPLRASREARESGATTTKTLPSPAPEDPSDEVPLGTDQSTARTSSPSTHRSRDLIVDATRARSAEGASAGGHLKTVVAVVLALAIAVLLAKFLG